MEVVLHTALAAWNVINCWEARIYHLFTSLFDPSPSPSSSQQLPECQKNEVIEKIILNLNKADMTCIKKLTEVVKLK